MLVVRKLHEENLCERTLDSNIRSSGPCMQAMAHDHDPEVMNLTSSGVGLKHTLCRHSAGKTFCDTLGGNILGTPCPVHGL